MPSQTQVPPKQRCLGAQTPPLPQRQSPVDEQLSERSSQAAQVEPWFPQLRSDRVAQVAPLQHPLGQDFASQTHWPPAQLWPAAHGGLSPHRHSPLAEQVSARPSGQLAQTAPFAPQVSSEGIWHIPREQQPSGQVWGVQAPTAASVWQSAEHPSPAAVFPSSQVSIPARIVLSPQTAGAPRVSSRSTSRPRSIMTSFWSEPATEPACVRPSTLTWIARAPSASETSTVADSVPDGESARG